MKRSLGARLARTLGGPPAPATVTADAPASERPGLDVAALDRWARLRATGQALERRATATPLAEAVDGHEVPTDHGPAFVIETRYRLTDHHGALPLGDFFERDLAHLPLVMGDPRLAGRRASEALFLDIEATGLDHGAGTQAFLIGLGHLDGPDFVVRQLLLRTPADEKAALQLVVDAVDAHPLLVSFNGKSYDLTVLQSRLVLQRFYSQREVDLKLRPHLDLLHISRNLYRDCFEDTRLGTLEREALGFERVDDVPGHLVPTLWFHWLRTGDAGPLAGVVLHNLHDVLSMVTLADRVTLGSVVVPRPERCNRRTANLGRLLLRRRDTEGALRVLRGRATQRAADADPLDAADRSLLRQTAAAARRGRDDALQRIALERLLAEEPDDPELLTMLAIVEARGGHDLPRALALAEAAHAARPAPESARRVARLADRLARAAPGG